VDDEGRVVGVITDRDVAVAAATRDLPPAAIRAADMVRGHVVACRPDDTVDTAMTLMRQHHVRRVVVTTEAGVLHGVVSLDDIALAAGRKGAASTTAVLSTFKAICARATAPVRHTAR
jgi:CBS domain-containing protein